MFGFNQDNNPKILNYRLSRFHIVVENRDEMLISNTLPGFSDMPKGSYFIYDKKTKAITHIAELNFFCISNNKNIPLEFLQEYNVHYKDEEEGNFYYLLGFKMMEDLSISIVERVALESLRM